MSSWEKLWYQQSANKTAIERAQELIQKGGMSLPCKVTAVSGQIVTVSFLVTGPWNLPEIEIPKAEGPWNFCPTQIGDFGFTMSADVYLGGVSGMGGGVADFSTRGNLGSTLVWVPVGNASFTPLDQNAGLSQGPNGWTMRTSDGTSTMSVSTTETKLTYGSNSFFVNSSEVGSSTGWTGTFATGDNRTVTVVAGLITNVA